MKIGRNAGSGQFIPVKQAQAHKKTAVVETIKRNPVNYLTEFHDVFGFSVDENRFFKS